MQKKKIQWHPGFVAAMYLEFAQNRNELIFEKEYNLNTKPLEIDLLVVKKEKTAEIQNEIGSFFRGHNIMEYKSPEDHLDIDVFYKLCAYACLYKSYGKTVDAIKAEEVTVSLIRETKPERLFKILKEQGYKITNAHKGIYYIENKVLFPTQVIVTKELEKAGHLWLNALSGTMQRKDMQELIERIRELRTKEEQEMADSVLQVSIKANEKLMQEMIGDENMCEALMEMLQPKLQQRENSIRLESLNKGIREGKLEGIREEKHRGIQGAVNTLKEFGHSDKEIQAAIMRNYALTEEEAEQFLK